MLPKGSSQRAVGICLLLHFELLGRLMRALGGIQERESGTLNHLFLAEGDVYTFWLFSA